MVQEIDEFSGLTGIHWSDQKHYMCLWSSSEDFEYSVVPNQVRALDI